MLTFVLKAAIGKEIIVELKNGMQIKGTLENTDPKMNLSLSNAYRRHPTPLDILLSREVEATFLDLTFVRTGMIRFVHFPPTFRHSKREISDYLKLLKFAKRRYQAHVRQ
eukprot:g3125.t1